MWETEFDWPLDGGPKIVVICEGMVHADPPRVFPLSLGFYIKPAAAGIDDTLEKIKREYDRIEEHAIIALCELVDEERRAV